MIRTLQATDAPEIARIWLEGILETAVDDPSFRPLRSLSEYAESLAAEFDAGTSIGWGVFADATPEMIAYLMADITPANADLDQPAFLYLQELDVAREHRRHGLGAQLVATAKAFAREQQLTSVEVNWVTTDPRATTFWLKQGFVQYVARGRCRLV